MTELSGLPYFCGKELAIEARDRGIKAIGSTDDIKGAMIIGLIQIVKELRDEIRCLKEAAIKTTPPAAAQHKPLTFAGLAVTEIRLPKGMTSRFEGSALIIEAAHSITKGGES